MEVLEDLSLPGYPEVLAIGDMVRVRQADGSSTALPGLASVAMLYCDHEGGQPTITRYVLLPDVGEGWRCDVTRHWPLESRS